MAKNNKKLPTPRSPGGKALESSQFRHKVVPNKVFDEYDLRVCEYCGFKWADCECYDDDED